MKFRGFKYFLVFSFVTLLLIKVSNVTIYFPILSDDCIENLTTDDNPGEKEEKKIAVEFFEAYLRNTNLAKMPVILSTKNFDQNAVFKTSHFPEVLTPPPLFA